MNTNSRQEQLAIDQHSRQADEFVTRYEQMEADPFQDCFTYSRRRLTASLEMALPRVGNGLRVLDVGCGTGHQLAWLKAKGYEVVGVDGSKEMLERARATIPGVELQMAEVDRLPFADASFDFVLCIEVLRYLPSSEACVREMARVLKPGGICLATASPLLSINGYYFINRLACYIRISNFVRLMHFFTTSWRLKALFRHASFGDVDVRGVYWGPVNWIGRLFPGKPTRRFLRLWERFDSVIADRVGFRETSNMFLVRAVRS